MAKTTPAKLIFLAVLFFAPVASARNMIEPFPAPATEDSLSIKGGMSGDFFISEVDGVGYQYVRSSVYSQFWPIPWLSFGVAASYSHAQIYSTELSNFWIRGEPTFFAKTVLEFSKELWMTIAASAAYHDRQVVGKSAIDNSSFQSRYLFSFDLEADIFYIDRLIAIGGGLYYQPPEAEKKSTPLINLLRASWQADFDHEFGGALTIFGPFKYARPFGKLAVSNFGQTTLSVGTYISPVFWFRGWTALDINLIRPPGGDSSVAAPRPPWRFLLALELLLPTLRLAENLSWTNLDKPEEIRVADLRKSGVLISVRDIETEQPIDTAGVSVAGLPAERIGAGEYFIEDFLWGSAGVCTSAPQYHPAEKNIYPVRGIVVPMTIYLRSTLDKKPPPPNLRGRLADIYGMPLIGYIGDVEDIKRSIIPTELGGRFLTYLQPGKYRLIGYAEGFEPVVHEIEIIPNEKLEIDFILGPRDDRYNELVLARLDRNAGRIFIEQKIIFEFDSSRLSPESFPLLNRVANIIRNNPELRILIEGHTDEVGSDNYNLVLSRERAKSVRDYLNSVGIGSQRLEISGKGKKHPVCETSDAECLEKNRRVEFHIIDKTNGR